MTTDDKRADVHMKRLIQSHETPQDVLGIVSPWTRECNDWTKSTSRATLTDSLIGSKWYYDQKNNSFFFSLDFKTMLTKH